MTYRPDARLSVIVPPDAPVAVTQARASGHPSAPMITPVRVPYCRLQADSAAMGLPKVGRVAMRNGASRAARWPSATTTRADPDALATAWGGSVSPPARTPQSETAAKLIRRTDIPFRRAARWCAAKRAEHHRQHYPRGSVALMPPVTVAALTVMTVACLLVRAFLYQRVANPVAPQPVVNMTL